MKFGKRTVEILKNFATINPSLLFVPGKVLKTISPTKNIIAKAKLTDEFENRFAIYELPKFLSALSLFDDPELEIGSEQLTMSKNGRKLKYTFASEEHIIVPPSKDVKFPDPEVTFELKAEMLNELQRALGVLNLPDISVVGDGKGVILKAVDLKNPTTDSYNIGVADSDKKFNFNLKAENLKLLPGDYIVKMSSQKIALFEGIDIEYFIALEHSSEYDG